jgi:hypothetical protein
VLRSNGTTVPPLVTTATFLPACCDMNASMSRRARAACCPHIPQSRNTPTKSATPHRRSHRHQRYARNDRGASCPHRWRGARPKESRHIFRVIRCRVTAHHAARDSGAARHSHRDPTVHGRHGCTPKPVKIN